VQKKEARIKLQEEKIAMLTRKPDKQPARSLAKSSEREEEERAFDQSEASEEVHSKKGGKLKNGGSLSLMTVEQIQDLIANTVKLHLGAGVRRPTSTLSLTSRGLMRSTCLRLSASKSPAI